MSNIRTNGIKAWILAARPKTLTGAAAPVLIGGAYALQSPLKGETSNSLGSGVGVYPLLPFLLCLLFALIMQIDANFINDWWDFRKGTDREDRLGPERACAQGWVTPNAMKWAIILTSTIACCVGLPLVFYGGWMLIGIGILCVAGAFLYTTKMSYLGLGDIMVIIFFGIIPVFFTYYVTANGQQSAADSLTFSLLSFPPMLLGLATGLVIDTLLMINNYRDREQDKISGKMTIMVRVNKTIGLWLYWGVGALGAVIAIIIMSYSGNLWWFIELVYLALHSHTSWKMKSLSGKALNRILGETSRNIILFAICTCLALMLK